MKKKYTAVRKPFLVFISDRCFESGVMVEVLATDDDKACLLAMEELLGGPVHGEDGEFDERGWLHQYTPFFVMDKEYALYLFAELERRLVRESSENLGSR